MNFKLHIVKLLLVFGALLFLPEKQGYLKAQKGHVSIQSSMPLVKTFVISDIQIDGNKITKEKIIRRELTFSEGDTLQAESIDMVFKSCRENLLNTSLFNFVTFFPEFKPNGDLKVSIKVEERWYTWPRFVLKQSEPNINVWMQNKDWSRLKYGISLERYNFRGMKEVLKFELLGGYDKKFSIFYRDAFLDYKRRHSLGGHISYSKQNEVNFEVENNKQLFYKRHAKGVTETYYARMFYLFRQHIHNSHFVSFSYQNTSVCDSVALLNNDYLGEGRTNIQFLSFRYEFKSDHRDYKSYPLDGYFFGFVFNQDGPGLSNTDKISNTYFESSLNQYFPISDLFYWSTGLSLKKAFQKKVPYMLRRGLGYDEIALRGYEYYIVDGQDYLYLKNTFKTRLMPTQVVHFQQFPLPWFNKIHYALFTNAFVDFGYVADHTQHHRIRNNSLSNQLLMGAGVGLDFVTYYDSIMRLEYSINKMGEHGFYIHFKAPF